MPQITLPNLGENIDSGDVLSILVSEGDTVTKDQDLLEIETDKATMPVPSPTAGKITKVLVSEGDTVKIGAPIFEVEPAGGSAPAAPAQAEAPKPAAAPAPPAEAPKPAAAQAPATRPSPAEAESDIPAAALADGIVTGDEMPAAPAPPAAEAPAPRAPAPPAPEGDVPGDGHSASAAGPAVRRLARELGVELRRVRATGDGGRITEEDVRSHVRESNKRSAESTPSGAQAPGAPSSDALGATRVEKMSRLRQTIAKNMVASYTTIPQLTNFDDVDVTDLEDMRQQSKDDYAKQGIKLSQMPFLIKALAASLKMHPVVNASVNMDEAQVVYKEYVHIGVAVDTERGLMVPVLRDADRLSMSQIARELDRLIAAARDGKLTLDEMRGGTFTISNMGAVGGTYSTPIINPPEVAILLVGRSRMLPTVMPDGKTIAPRLIMPLSLTYDHRVVDGADAARFLNDVKGFLAAPGRLLLAP